MDYDRVPVSLGVTALAAFPIAFTPVLLHDDPYPLPDDVNSSLGCQGQRNAHLPYRVPSQVAGGPYANLEAYRIARCRQSLRNEAVTGPGTDDQLPPHRTPIYLRLVDGGVADNSGLTALRRALLDVGAPANIGRLAAQPRVRDLAMKLHCARRNFRARLTAWRSIV
jgi:NTE family protein